MRTEVKTLVSVLVLEVELKVSILYIKNTNKAVYLLNLYSRVRSRLINSQVVFY
jgi:Cdc6-like AAA superfamily ATPase